MIDPREHSEWLLITVIAFMGGIVANIVAPLRRGMWGFIGAAVIGIFCGGVAGLCANSFQASPGWQFVAAAAFAVLGDRILSAILVARQDKLFSFQGDQNNFSATTNSGQINQGEELDSEQRL